MDKYKDAFGNLKVPEDMARRVTEKLAQEPENFVPISAAKKKKRPWATVAACAACLALILGAWSISKPNGQLPAVTAPVETDDSGVQTANPMQDVSIQNSGEWYQKTPHCVHFQCECNCKLSARRHTS